MRATTFVAIIVVAGLLGLPAAAAAQAACCKDPKEPCCTMQTQTCCDHVRDVIGQQIARLSLDKRPTVERMVVSFRNPVVVGDRILMGKYVIEHDTDRMARGRPCTFIYAYGDMRLPTVAFHCTHLKRAYHGQASVTLVADHSAGLKRLVEFQFAGEAAGHGVPVVR
jgi:hypothetical protein